MWIDQLRVGDESNTVRCSPVRLAYEISIETACKYVVRSAYPLLPSRPVAGLDTLIEYGMLALVENNDPDQGEEIRYAKCTSGQPTRGIAKASSWAPRDCCREATSIKDDIVYIGLQPPSGSTEGVIKVDPSSGLAVTQGGLSTAVSVHYGGLAGYTGYTLRVPRRSFAKEGLRNSLVYSVRLCHIIEQSQTHRACNILAVHDFVKVKVVSIASRQAKVQGSSQKHVRTLQVCQGMRASSESVKRRSELHHNGMYRRDHVDIIIAGCFLNKPGRRDLRDYST